MGGCCGNLSGDNFLAFIEGLYTVGADLDSLAVNAGPLEVGVSF